MYFHETMDMLDHVRKSSVMSSEFFVGGCGLSTDSNRGVGAPGV
jgi:hypothetical protein